MAKFATLMHDPLNPEEQPQRGFHTSLEEAHEAARNTIDEGLQLLWQRENSAEELVGRYLAQYFFPVVIGPDGEAEKTLDLSAYLAHRAAQAVLRGRPAWVASPEP